MPAPTGSKTAHVVAYLRAAHQHRPANCRLVVDPVANALLRGPIWRWAARSSLMHRFVDLWLKGGIDQLVARDRFADDFARSLGERLQQVVVLGAGLDTMPWRLRDELKNVTFFEVDFPATQQHKLARLSKQPKLSDHPRCRFLAMDFTRDDLTTTLINGGYSREALTFVNWMGVTYYLSHDIIREMLLTLHRLLPAESVVTFDYITPNSPARNYRRNALRRMGEEMMTFYTPDEISRLAGETGYRILDLCTPHEYATRCLGRNPGWISPLNLAALARI